MSDGVNEGQGEGLRDSFRQKREAKQQQQPRQRKLTYVAGLDGRRYVNDKILRNLEVSQRNHYGDYIAYATPENVGNQPYDPFQPIDPNELSMGYAGTGQQQGSQPSVDDYDEYHELHQEDLTYQEPQQESHARDQWDETIEPAPGSAVNLNPADVANADLESAFQRAQPSQQMAPHFGQDVSKSAPPSVPLSSTTASPAPSGSREAYNKMLGGLFKDEVAVDAPQHEIPPAPMEPDFSGASDSAQVAAAQSAQPQPQSYSAQEQYAANLQAYVDQQQHAQQVQQEQLSREEQLSPQAPLSPQEQVVLQAAQQQQGPARTPRKTFSIQKSLLGDDDDDLATSPQAPHAVPNRPKPNRIPIKIQRVAPPLPQQRNDEIYFEDNATSGKTSVFKMPKEGVVSSSRGTVELLVHKGGRMFRPHYNPVGILLRVDVSDGFSLIKGDTDRAHWLMTDRSGNPLDEEEIVSVAFDKKGNLWYETVSGKKTKFLVSGGVEVTGDKK